MRCTCSRQHCGRAWQSLSSVPDILTLQSAAAAVNNMLLLCAQGPLPEPEEALQTQQTALRASLAEHFSDTHSVASAGSTASSKKHKPGNWAGMGLVVITCPNQSLMHRWTRPSQYSVPGMRKAVRVLL